MEKLLITIFTISILCTSCGKKNQFNSDTRLPKDKSQEVESTKEPPPLQLDQIIEISPKKDFVINIDGKEAQIESTVKNQISWKRTLSENLENESIDYIDSVDLYRIKLSKKAGEIHFNTLKPLDGFELLFKDKDGFIHTIDLAVKTHSFTYNINSEYLYFEFRLKTDIYNDYYVIDINFEKLFLVHENINIKDFLKQTKNENLYHLYERSNSYLKDTSFDEIPLNKKITKIINSNNKTNKVYIVSITKKDLNVKRIITKNFQLNYNQSDYSIHIPKSIEVKIKVTGIKNEYFFRKVETIAPNQYDSNLPAAIIVDYKKDIRETKINQMKDIVIEITDTRDGKEIIISPKFNLISVLLKERGKQLPLVPYDFEVGQGQSKTILEIFHNSMNLEVQIEYLELLN